MSSAPQNRLFVRISGIECQNCIDALTRALGAVEGVASVRFLGHVAEMEIDRSADGSPGGLDAQGFTGRIVAAVRAAGYETRPEWISPTRPWRGAIASLAMAAALVAAWCGLRALLGFDPLSLAPSPDGAGSLGALFAVGLLTGFHCAGMCGALAISAASGGSRPWVSAALYNFGRLATYTAIGAAAGALGAAFHVGPRIRGALLLFAACAMLLVAARSLGWVPFASRSAWRRNRESRTPRGPVALRPLLVGAANGFMPCGPLQSVQLWALASGGAARGAAAMLAFGLGTAPALFAVGAAAGFFARRRAVFGRIAAAIMIALALGMARRGIRAWSADPGTITYDCCERPGRLEAPETNGTPAEPETPYLGLAPGADGFVAVPFSRVTDKALFVNVPEAGLPTVQLIALRDRAGRPRIAFNTCQSCNPAPRAFFIQLDDGRIQCQNCGNVFGPEAVGSPSGGCSPARIPGLVEAADGFRIPADSIDAARPAFANWTGPLE
ncbi:MAG: DUF2318 domain-containing protein [Kiritimatiellae bacterium]|nr:DUF2318 domain-containing protein [Kiritimatiellia bacterium]